MKAYYRQFFALFVFSLPFQLSKHFWLPQALVLGRRIDYLTPAIFISDITLVVAVMTSWWARRRSRSSLLLLLGAACAVLASAWLTTESIITISALVGTLKLLLVPWLVWVVRPRWWEWRCALGLSIVLTAILVVGQFLEQGSLNGWWYWLGERRFDVNTPGIAKTSIQGLTVVRPYATFPHPNALSGFLLASLPLFIFYPKDLSGASKFKAFLVRVWPQLRLTVISFVILGIALSLSRAAWLTGVIVVGLWIFAKARRLGWSKLNWFLWLIGLVFILLIEEVVVGRFSNWWHDATSIKERLKLLQAAGGMIAQKPVLGVGLGQFIYRLPAFLTPPYVLQPVHSHYLLVAAEAGLVGLAVFLLLVALSLLYAYKHGKWAVFWALIVVCLLGLFDHYFITLPQTRLLFALLISLAVVKTK